MSLKFQIAFVFIIMYVSLNHLFFPDLLFQLTNYGHWAVVLLHGLLQLLFIWIYLKGLSYFPQQDVIDILLKMGKPIAILFLFPFVIFLTALISINNRLHSDFIITNFLSRTPSYAVLILLFFATTYIALSGIGAILRASFFIFFMIIPLLVLITFTSLVNVDWSNAMPVLPIPTDFLQEKKFIYLMGYSAFLPLGFMTYKTKITFGSIFLAWLCVMFFFLSSVYIPLLIFGQEAALSLTFSMVRAIYTVDVDWFILHKQSTFLGLSLVGFTLIFNSVLLWMIGRIMNKLFHFKKGKSYYWVISFSIAAFISAHFIPNMAWTEKAFLWCTGVQVYFMIIIPFTILVYGLRMKRSNVYHAKG